MADILAIFGTLFVLGIAFPGLLVTTWSLFPRTVERAQTHLEQKPGRCFGQGLALILFVAIPFLGLLSTGIGPAQLVAWLLFAVFLIFAGFGIAGLAAKMGCSLAQHTSGAANPASSFLRAAVALELAIFFPVIGWVFLLPYVLAIAVGATTLSILSRGVLPESQEMSAGDPFVLHPSAAESSS